MYIFWTNYSFNYQHPKAFEMVSDAAESLFWIFSILVKTSQCFMTYSINTGKHKHYTKCW